METTIQLILMPTFIVGVLAFVMRELFKKYLSMDAEKYKTELQSDLESHKARLKSEHDANQFEFQTKFDYWINMFEATYGNIAVFWNNTKASDSEKIILLNNLIKDLINTNINLKTENNGGKETDSKD